MIRQYDAQVMCDNELRKHGLYAQGWRTNFAKTSAYLARCEYGPKRIVFSIHFLSACSEVELRDVIIHEIAHALCPGQEHNYIWIEKAKALGLSDPKPCGTISKDSMLSVSPTEVKETKKIKSLQSLCPRCGATAIETSFVNLPTGRWAKLECGHLVKADQMTKQDISNWQNTRKTKTIFGYQVEGFRFVEAANGRALIADEPALGKTIQAMAFTYFHKDAACPVLWVTKSSLVLQAIKEYIDLCGPEFMGQVITSSKSFIIPGLKLYVISMDLLRRIDDEKLSGIGFKTVIVDEIQHFKNPESSRANELRKLVKQCDFFLATSGTPWKNIGTEYFTVLNLIAPDRFPSLRHFENNWVDTYYDEKSGKYKTGGIRNIEAFKKITQDIVIRRLRSEVQKDLPEINRQVRFVDMEELYNKSYEKAEKNVAERIKDSILEGKNMGNIAGELMRLKHITGLAKVDVLCEDIIEFLNDASDADKFSIGVHHIDVGDLIEQRLNPWLKENGYLPCLRLRGGEPIDKRDSIQEEFKNNPKAKIFIISTLAGGEGLNLQFCDNACQLERQWNPANEEQFELRFSRPITVADLPEYLKNKFKDKEGRKTSIRFPYYIAAGTVDEILTEIVERKRANFKKVMDSHVCPKCNGRNTVVRDNEMHCNNCRHIESFAWSESNIVRELGEAIVKKRYGKQVGEALIA